MTYQTRKTPESDAEFLMALTLCGGNRSELAQMYGVDESAIRRRIRRIEENTLLQKMTDELRARLITDGMSVDEAFSFQIKRATGRGI
jgi:DNA-binding MarR family transcriptional regulator